MLLQIGPLLRLGPNVITDGTFITLGSNQSNHYTCAFYSCKGCTDLESFSATSAVRYKIANLAFAEMLKGTEVKNIVTATGGVSDYIPGQDLFVYRQDGIISGHQCRCLIENPFSRKTFFLQICWYMTKYQTLNVKLRTAARTSLIRSFCSLVDEKFLQK